MPTDWNRWEKIMLFGRHELKEMVLPLVSLGGVSGRSQSHHWIEWVEGDSASFGLSGWSTWEETVTSLDGVG